MPAKLVVVDGSRKGEHFALAAEAFTIGRQEGNHLQLREAEVSRRHCAVFRLEDGYELRDAGSAQGTLVGGRPLQRHRLRHGDLIQVGRTTLLFVDELAGSSARPEEADAAASTRGRAPGAAAPHGLLGESPAMVRLRELISRVAPFDSTVLLRGESGTGKELAALALHRASPRSQGPFVAINCATLSETLLESELFGHERGAFTGAVARKLGKIEVADRGTLFLDEIGEMPPTVQARLLRALQEKRIERVGGNQPIAVDVRLIAATHRDLEAAIAGGAFREDLFYRLDVISLTLPPLRERREDIELLARHFARQHGERLQLRDVAIDPAVLPRLAAADWPGNVRQLSNVIERAVVLGDGRSIRPADLPEELLAGGVAPAEAEPAAFQSALLETKKKLLLATLAEAKGNAAEAGRRLGLHPNSFRRLMRRLGLKESGES